MLLAASSLLVIQLLHYPPGDKRCYKPPPIPSLAFPAEHYEFRGLGPLVSFAKLMVLLVGCGGAGRGPVSTQETTPAAPASTPVNLPGQWAGHRAVGEQSRQQCLDRGEYRSTEDADFPLDCEEQLTIDMSGNVHIAWGVGGPPTSTTCGYLQLVT